MNRLPVWFELAENLAIGAAVVVAFVHLHFSWWWLPVLFMAFDVSMVGYVLNNRVGAVCYQVGRQCAGLQACGEGGRTSAGRDASQSAYEMSTALGSPLRVTIVGSCMKWAASTRGPVSAIHRARLPVTPGAA